MAFSGLCLGLASRQDKDVKHKPQEIVPAPIVHANETPLCSGFRMFSPGLRTDQLVVLSGFPKICLAGGRVISERPHSRAHKTDPNSRSPPELSSPRADRPSLSPHFCLLGPITRAALLMACAGADQTFGPPVAFTFTAFPRPGDAPESPVADNFRGVG